MALSFWDWLIINGDITVHQYVIITVIIPILVMVALLGVCWLYNVVYCTDWRRLFRRKRK